VKVLTVGVVNVKELLHMRLFPGKREVEDAEVVLVGLHGSTLTSLSITSLLSSIRASLVLQSVEFTTVAEYPARAVQMTMSRKAVALRR
jgi:hypothetical protein